MTNREYGMRGPEQDRVERVRTGARYVFAMRGPEGIKWGMFDMRHEQSWVKKAELVFCSRAYPTGSDAFKAEMDVKRTTRDHMKGIGTYHESVVPVLQASKLGQW